MLARGHIAGFVARPVNKCGQPPSPPSNNVHPTERRPLGNPMIATKPNPTHAVAGHLRLVTASELRPCTSFESSFSAWVTRHSVLLLRISLAIVFVGFGLLKLFPGV